MNGLLCFAYSKMLFMRKLIAKIQKKSERFYSWNGYKNKSFSFFQLNTHTHSFNFHDDIQRYADMFV